MIRDLNNIPALIHNVDSILQATAEVVGEYIAVMGSSAMVMSPGNGV